MRVLITGGLGFLGRAVTANLADHGHDVIVVSRRGEAPPRCTGGTRRPAGPGRRRGGRWQARRGYRGAPPADETRALVADTRRIREMLGWQPTRSSIEAVITREPTRPEFLEVFVGGAEDNLDPRVMRSQEEWRRTRRALNASRPALTKAAATFYGPEYRLGTSDMIAHPSWLPAEPVNLSAIELNFEADSAPPTIDGTELETEHVRPRTSPVRRYPRYTQAIRDLAHPRLFDNRLSWRLTNLSWSDSKCSMDFTSTTYFEALDIYEAVAHELAYMALDEGGTMRQPGPQLRDLPFRRLLGDPFDLARRPLLPSIDTLTIRRDESGGTFVLHHRDPRNVAVAGGMLHVMPCGVFQPSSIVPAVLNADFDLWRNIMREYSEEFLGNPEHGGDGQPVRYDQEPFASLDQARRDGRVRVYCLGVALDSLTLVGEILTVAVFDADLFDSMAVDFVDLNDEGSVANREVPFTEEGIGLVLDSGSIAPGGAGLLELAWRHREILLAG